ncbi:hypothetical protein OROGR_000999 [Orobanche gracilis]
MAEEFEESEVIFEDKVDEYGETNEACSFELNPRESRNGSNNKARRQKLKTEKNKTAPVNIPRNLPWLRYTDADLDGGCEGEMVPPHVILRRRVAGNMMAFSVCTGNGRTLKGRDLSEVRNSILRMTGFLET